MKNMFVVISLVVSLFALILAGALSVSAAEAVVLITSEDDFVKLMNGTYSWGDSYKLTNEINISSITQISIGNDNEPFTGTFDGNGNAIKGITAPVFGTISGATIKKLTVEGAINTSVENTAGVVGLISGSGTVENCVNKATVTSTAQDAGGVVGEALGNTASATIIIDGCINYGDITGKKDAGGIVARFDIAKAATSGTYHVNNCANYGAIVGTENTGGIIGLYSNNATNSVSYVENNYNRGNISTGGNQIGGVVGFFRVYAKTMDVAVRNCMNSGKISSTLASAKIGGIVGQGNGSTGAYVLESNYNSGSVSNLDNVNEGPIAGTMHANATVKNNYALDIGEAYGVTNYATTVTEENYADASTFAGLSKVFWVFTENGPVLLTNHEHIFVDGNCTVCSPASLLDQIEVLGGKGGTVVLEKDTTVEDGTVIPEQTGNLTITSKNGAKLILGGSLVFEKNQNINIITLDVPVSMDEGVIYGGFNSIIFTENFVVEGVLDYYGGYYNVECTTNGATDTDAEYYYEQNQLICTELPYDIVVNGGTFRHFMGGNYRSTAYSLLGSVAAPITITVNGGTFGMGVSYGADTALKVDKAFCVSGMSILASDATLTINGGTFNTPIYVQGYVGQTSVRTSGCSQYTNSDKKFYAADGDVAVNINGGTLNGFAVGATQITASYSQLLRGNYTVTVTEEARLIDSIVFDATQVKGYTEGSAIASITYPTTKTIDALRFDTVNGVNIDYDEPTRIACVGDSITQGSKAVVDGVENYELASYPSMLYKKLFDMGEDVVVSNYGCHGARVTEYNGLYYKDGLAYTLSMEETDPDYVIIGLGSNDAKITTYSYGMQDRFYGDYFALVAGYEALESTDMVYGTSAIYRESNDVAAVSNIRAMQSMVFNSLEEYGKDVTYIDLYALLLDDAISDRLLSSDKLHPHADGYAIYADAIYNAIYNGICKVEGFEQEHIYVSASGTNNMEASEENPTNNIAIAFAKAIDGSTIHINGTYDYTRTASVKYGFPTPINVKDLTILGEGTNAVLNLNSDHFHIKNDVILDNIGIYTSTGGTLHFACGYNNVTFTESFKSSNALFAAGMVVLGEDKSSGWYNSRASISSDADCVIHVNGGDFATFLGGNYLYSTYENAIYGTYSGNMIINIGEGVTISSSAQNGACGQNYLTGNITFNAASWPSGETVRAYSHIGSATESLSYDAARNTGTITINQTGLIFADIATVEEFVDLMNDSSKWSGNYKLAADIDLTGIAQTSIGDSTTPYAGVFDGNGYTIKGISAPVFGEISGATVKNLTVEGTVNASTAGAAGIVGVITNIGTVQNCINYATVTSTADRVGGVVGVISGKLSSGTIIIDGCVNYGDVMGSTNVGGVVGRFETGADGINGIYHVQNCANYGAINANESVSGVIGLYTNNASYSLSYIENNFNAGEVESAGDRVGGIAGYFRVYAKTMMDVAVRNCMNSGKISSTLASAKIGGIVGQGNGSSGAYVLENNYNSGSVSNLDNANEGPIAGTIHANATVKNNYALDIGETYGVTDYSNMVTEENYADASTFAGLSKVFWVFTENGPVLLTHHEHTFVDGNCTICGEAQCSHTTIKDVVTLVPTCTETGKKNVVCTNCDTVIEKDVALAIDSANHGDFDYISLNNEIVCSNCKKAVDAPDAPVIVSAIASSENGVVSVTVSIKAVAPILASRFVIDAPDGFTLVSAESLIGTADENTSGFTLILPDSTLLPYEAIVMNLSLEDATVDAAVLKLTFAVADNVSEGNYIISVNALETYDISGTAIDTTSVPCEVSVSARKAGDIDGNGVVTVLDVMKLIRAIVNDETIENGDVNGDGKVTLIDVIRVIKLITQ